MSAVAALRRKRLRQTKAQLVDELEQTEKRLFKTEAVTSGDNGSTAEFQRQKTFFEAVFRDVSDVLVLTDPDRKIVMCNPAMTQIFGYTPGEIEGQSTALLYADRKEFIRQGRVRFNPKAKEQLKPYLINYKRKDGRNFPGETIGEPVRDSAGRTLGFLGIIRDASERTRSETETARLWDVVENLAEGLAFYDPDDRLIFCNEEYRNVHPIIRDLLEPGIKFEDLVRAHVESGAIPEAKGREKSYIRERMKLHRHPKGPIMRELADDIWFIIKEGRTPEGGTYCITTDISQIKKSETNLRNSQEQFLGAMNALQEGFALYNADDQLVLFNEEYRRLHPKLDDILKPGMLFEDMVRTNIDRGLNADAIGHEEKHIHERMECHRNPKGPILRTLTDGTSYTIKESRTPDGGVVVTETDITERLRAREASERLSQAIENVPVGIALFDNDDRLVFFNSRYLEHMEVMADVIKPGVTFEEMVQAIVTRQPVLGAQGREEEYIRERMERHRNPTGPLDLRRDDKWLQANENHMPDGSIFVIITDITELKRAESLERARNQILEQVAAGGPLADTLTQLVAVAEEMNPKMLASVLVLDDDGQRLRLGAAPSLPRFYNEAVDGIRIGPKEGSCGAAAFSGERVIVEDVTTHPNWKKFKNTAVKAGLHACWSQPIKSAAGKVLGTFAMYYREPHAPADADLVAIEGMARLAAIAIERENMIHDLRDSEARLRGAIESMQEGFALFDAEDRLVALNDKYRDVNPAAQGIMERGGTYEEVLRANVERGALVEAIGREEAFIKSRLRKHRNPKEPIIRRTSDGHWYMLQEVKTPEGGTALSFIDITELKTAETALQESEASLRAVFDNTPICLNLKDTEGRYLLVNKPYEKWLGHPAKEIIGKKASEFLEDAHETAHIDAAERKMLKTGEAYESEIRARRHGGTTFHDRILIKFPVRSGDGPITGIGTAAIDITERKRTEEALIKSEERMRGAIDSMQEGFALYDAEDRLVAFNEKYRSLRPEVQVIMERGGTFEDVTRANLKYEIIPEAIGREEAFIKGRLRQHRNPKGPIIRQFSDGSWSRVEEVKTPEGGTAITFIDITELKQAEEALRESEQRFRDIAESTSDWFWEMGPDLRFTYFSERYAEVTGFPIEERIGTSRLDHSPENYTEEELEQWNAHIADQKAKRPFKNFEYATTATPRGLRYVRVSGRPVFGKDGEFLGYRGTGTDITKRKRAEQTLRESEERFRAVIEHSPGVIIIKDLKGRYLITNKMFCDWYRTDIRNIRRKTVYDFLTKKSADHITAKERTVVETGEVVEEERQETYPDGVTRDIFAQKFPVFGPDGDTVAIGTVINDITGRKQAEEALRETEERFRAVVECSPGAIVIRDLDGRNLIVNKIFCDWHGIQKKDLLGKSAHDFLDKEIADEIGAQERKVRNTGTIIDMERQITYPNGVSREIFSQKFPIFGPAGDCVAIGTVLNDITGRKQAEEALIKSEERVRGAIDSMQEGFVLFDAEDRLVMINDVYRRINPAAGEYLERRMSYEDLMRANVESGRIVEAIGREKAFLRERMKQHRDPKGPIIRHYTDGKCYILKETRTPEGGIALTFTDITELKRAESALRESEERFRDVAESAGDWIWEMGTDLRFAFLSERFFELFPVEPKKIIGKTQDEFAGMSGDDERWRRHLKEIADHKPFRDFDYAVTVPSGNARYIRISGKPVFDGDGTFKGYRGTGTDVTVTVEAEAAAAKAQALLFDAVESITVGFALFDRDDRLVLSNTRYRNLHPTLAELAVPGISFQELIEGAAKAGVYHDSMGPRETFLEKRMAYHRNTPSSHEQRYSDGRWLEINEYSTQEGGTVLIWTDITERRQAELALQESEALLNSIIENLPVGLLIKGPDHIIERANGTFLSWYGFDADNMAGLRSDEFEDYQSAEDAEFMNAQEREVMTTGLTQARQVDRPFADGQIHTIDITKFPVYDQQGKITRVGSVSVDLTEQVQAQKALAHGEMRFRDFAESSSDWFWEMDGNLRFAYFSDRFTEISGVPDEDLIGKTRQESGLDMEDESVRRNIEDLEAHRPFKSFEHSRVRPDGSVVHMSTSGTPVFDEDGAFKGYRGTGTDITERKLLERQLTGSQRMEALGKLTGGVAHDFNNLLTVILGNLQLLERRIQDQHKLKRYVELASGAAQRGAELTTRLLAFARRQRLDIAVFDCNGQVAGMAALIRGTLGEMITLETNLPDELWPVKADPNQLENALLNLVVNAKDAMPEGGKFTIETANVIVDNTIAGQNPDAFPGDYVMIAVGDTGCGMPSEVADHALEPFFTTKEIGKGTGLGLSLVYGFVKQSDGFVKIYSEPDHGTVVKLYLPRFRIQKELLADEEALQGEPVGGNETILLVEDDPDVRRTALELLEELGYQVIEAEDGPSALRIFDNHPEIDLLFTDVVMPGGMKGTELAREVLKRHAGMKVLYMSGYTEFGAFNDDMGEAEGMLLRKPFEKGDLADKLRLTLDS